ncbi:unnamed protein product [Schistocephalus solidus]|uniref:F-box/LRR-repeat protein n=1 Tax=Schistocephalus solidus TaxID=70667 RepID=A0A183TSC5_SCHSO|nr:unnamed protein product [Schistocephalus solidus]
MRKRLLRLKDKCLNIRKATVIASEDLVFTQQLRPSAKDISTYLSVLPSLEEVRIIGVGISKDQTIHKLLATCGHIQRLYIFSLNTLNFQYAALPPHNALELLFLEINGLFVGNNLQILLNQTLSKLHSLRYLLLKFAKGRHPRVNTLKAFFAARTELRWLVVVFKEDEKVLLCHADEASRNCPTIIKDTKFRLRNLIHTYPELYDIFWKEFLNFSNILLH